MKIENLLLRKDDEVYRYQKLEREIFNLALFSPHVAVFPRNAFIGFDLFYQLEVKDWFSAEIDFEKLILFLRKIGSDYFYASAPSFYMLNAAKIFTENSYEAYSATHAYLYEEGSLKGLGLRKSPETFYYGKEKSWAIICDITNNVTVAGISNGVQEEFEQSFPGVSRIFLNSSGVFD